MRIILARALVKDEQGLPLTAKEEDLLAELYRRKHLNYREKMYVDDNGSIVVRKTVDAEPIMDAMKAYGDFIDRYASRKHSARMIGAIDPMTAAEWSRETGAKIGSREFAKFAMKRIKNDSDYRRFKVGN